MTSRRTILPVLLSVLIISYVSYLVPLSFEATPGIGGGLLRGRVLGCCDLYGRLMSLAWADIVATDGRNSFVTYSYSDGLFEMYLPSGVYRVTISEPGWISQAADIAVSDGSTNYGMNFTLERSQEPIPEFADFGPMIIAGASIGFVLMLGRRLHSRKRRH